MSMNITMRKNTTPMSINRLVLSFSALFVLACSDLTGEDTGAHNITKVATSEVGGINAVDVGEGRFLLEGVAGRAGNSRHKFHLRFRLSEGEPLAFFFFASRKNLLGGLELLWMRTDGNVTVEFSLNGITHRHRLPLFDDREEIDVDVDVHNDHTDIHILMWEKSGSRSDHEGCSFDRECLYNTEDFALDVWLGVGRASGVHWGVQGNRDLIISLAGPLTADSDA